MRTLAITIMGMLMANMKHFTRPLAVALIVLGFAAQAQGPFQVKVTSTYLGNATVGHEVELRGQTTPDVPCSNGAYGDVFPLYDYWLGHGLVTASLYPGLCNVSWTHFTGGSFSFWLHEDGCLAKANGCTLTGPLQAKVATHLNGQNRILFIVEVLDGNCGTQDIAGLTSQEVDSGFKGDTGDTGDDGPQGPQGKVGPAGTDGTDGAAGTNGTDGTQGPQGKVGATGADAPCKPCADVAGAAVDLSCKILDVNPATNIQELRDTAQVVVDTLLISTNVCETECDIGAEINAAIDTKLDQ